MSTEALAVRRLPVRLTSDPRYTITRFFWLGPARARKIVERVMRLSDEQTAELLTRTRQEFEHLDVELTDVFLNHYEEAARRVDMPRSLTADRKRLLGAYFTLEYAFASVAMFNPSITAAINQRGVKAGSLRFAMSLRCIGEGHLSSIVFRRGIVDGAGNITLEPAGPYREPKRTFEDRQVSKAEARAKLAQLGVRETALEAVLGRLDDPFTVLGLRALLFRMQADTTGFRPCDDDLRKIEWLTSCDYCVKISPDAKISQVVLFPICEAESRGMEDMRIVRFTDEDGSMRYYGTYTAYNGWLTRPQIMEMTTPGVAHVHSLQGRCVKDKGLALFPRKVQGRYMMSGRIDGENLYVLQSDNVRVWDEAVLIQEPKFTWDSVQIGNCGSPIETEAGWLQLTHGVGPMRRYCIGASLLDLNDPTKLIGRLEEPLIMPTAEERTGYVPNVVYSCGALVHSGLLIIPYGISDAATSFATVALDDLLAKLC